MKKCMGCMRDYSDEMEICPVCGYSQPQVEADLREMPDIIPPETILAGRYIVGRGLSYTNFSIVYVAWDALLQKRVAIKEYFPVQFGKREIGRLDVEFVSPEDQTRFLKGRKIFAQEALKLHYHQNIPEIVEVYRCFLENNTCYMVMEYISGGTLQDYLKANPGKVDSKDANQIFRSLLNILAKLEENSMYHLNLSPDNVYLTESGDIKLIDFGLAKQVVYQLTYHKLNVYNTAFIAPEVLEGEFVAGGADLYSLGMIYYWLTTGKQPKVNAYKRKKPLAVRLKNPKLVQIIKSLTEPQLEKRPESVEQFLKVFGKTRKELLTLNGPE